MTTQRWPQALPRRKGLLYTEQPANASADAANVVVVPLSGGTPKIVARGGHYGRYVPTGHLVYLQHGTLFAVRFDLDSLETMGEAVPVVEGVLTNPNHRRRAGGLLRGRHTRVRAWRGRDESELD